MKQFSDLGLAETLVRAVSAEGYTHPTPIQAQAIPLLLAGRDLVGIAQTGTGKTAAFVLPLLHAFTQHRDRPQPKTCRALILAPTRELAAQIADSIRTYGRNGRLSVAVVVGGAKPGPQIRAMAQGVDILVATPGRLLDHMGSGAIRLDQTGHVVLDEADQMLDLGFMPAIRRIMAKVPTARQTVLLSATMPKQIRGLADDFLRNPAEVSVAPQSRPIERIEQTVVHLERAAKRERLIAILGQDDVERAIVFTRTKRGADRVSQHLEKAGLAAAAIHGDKSQGQRERALGAFRSGKVSILVATDIAARGIDVDDVSHVVNFELPDVAEAYVHRIGRTARAGKSGVAVSLCDATERGQLRDIERLIGRSLPATGTPANDAPASRQPNRSAGPRKPERNAKHPSRPGRPAGSKRPRKAAADAGGGAQPLRRPGRKARGNRNEAAGAGLSRMLENIGS